MTALVAFLVAALTLAATDDKPTAPRAGGDRARLQGTWTGKMGAQIADIQMEIVGDKVTLTILSQIDDADKFVIKGVYKIDETASPKAWDFLNGKGSDGRALPDGKSIYELDGDTLKLCNAPPGQPRPTDFKEQNPQTPQMIIVLTRMKPDARQVSPTQLFRCHTQSLRRERTRSSLRRPISSPQASVPELPLSWS